MNKRTILPMEKERIRLRLLEENDLPMTLAWRNQKHIRRWFLHSDVITLEGHRKWFERYRERDDDFVFIIEETQSLKRPIGQVAIYQIEWEARRAEFGRLMIGDRAATGQGLARVATELLVEEALRNWGLEEVYLEVIKDNVVARTIYTNCGFQAVGHRGNSLIMSKSRFIDTDVPNVTAGA